MPVDSLDELDYYALLDGSDQAFCSVEADKVFRKYGSRGLIAHRERKATLDHWSKYKYLGNKKKRKMEAEKEARRKEEQDALRTGAETARTSARISYYACSIGNAFGKEKKPK